MDRGRRVRVRQQLIDPIGLTSDEVFRDAGTESICAGVNAARAHPVSVSIYT
jgi:hypothetical protein